MGQKQSSGTNKKSRLSKAKIEATEIVDLESSESVSSQNTRDQKKTDVGSTKISTSCSELVSIISHVEQLEHRINQMTDSEIDLYFATVKDSLLNYWRKAYDIKNTDDDIKNQKAEIIDKIKIIIKNLNDRYLKIRMSS